MTTAIFAFLRAVFAHWWFLLTSGPFVVESVVDQVWSGYRAWADKIAPLQTRRRFYVCVLVFGFIVASFQAFNDEYAKNQKMQGELKNQEDIGAGVWPRLTDTQKDRLRSSLAKNTGRILITTNDSGGVGLEKDLVEVFLEAGWQPTSGASIDAISTGIQVQGAKNDQVAKKLPSVIHYATGLPVEFFEQFPNSYKPKDYMIMIVIGTKPI
jgi:hypothetical protein